MSTKSKKKSNTIILLIDKLLTTDMYHPHIVEHTNHQLNKAILTHIKKDKVGSNKHLYLKIKEDTDQLAVLSHAAINQPILVRTMSNRQYELIQQKLKQLKHKLQHQK